MRKIVLVCLAIMCVFVSSSAFSAMPKGGGFPIEIVSSREEPNDLEKEMYKYLVNAFQNSPYYRITNTEENRIVISILISKYNPGVISSDWLASATPVSVISIVWLAKPKSKHPYFLWHDIGRITDYKQFSQYVLEQTDSKVWAVKNQCPYVFD